MNINKVNDQQNFCASLKIKTIKNKGVDPYVLRLKQVVKLSKEEITKLKDVAATKGKSSDRITIKLNANPDVFCYDGKLYDKQTITAITDIGNDLDAFDLSRNSDIDIANCERMISDESPFKVILNFLNELNPKTNK